MARIDLIDVCTTLGAFRIENLRLRIPDGRTLVILGPSGCGKTTLLKIIAGLITPESGEVRYDGVDVKETGPGARRIGMVFQNYALYPHMNSRANVLSYFLFRKKTPELDAMAKAKYQRTAELMGVELTDLMDRKPRTLSGGEKQRVAVARCITRDPALFLMDEPFSNLDQALREKYRVSLKILLKQFDITTVHVTHDHYEAMILADLLAIMNVGRIEQVATYQEIYDEPRNAFVAGFLNRHIGAPPISFIDANEVAQGRGLGNVRIGVRPEDVAVLRQERPDGTKGIVDASVSLPLINATILDVRVGEHEIHAQAGAGESFRAGDQVWLRFKRYHVFDEAGVRLRTESA
jgi:ABC-type sugar transport system ATPase subunit